jgi:hypothetical protein
MEVAEPGVLLKVWFPLELTNGNTGRGHSWKASRDFRDRCEALFRAWGLTRSPFDHPVDVTVIRVLGKHQRLWDASSVLRGNWKEIEDSLVAIGWFVDDSPQWVPAVTPVQDTTQRDKGPGFIVEIQASRAASAPGSGQ